jgi:twitching motility protein PilT
MGIKELLRLMVEKDASDLFLRVSGRPHMRLDGKVIPVGETISTKAEIASAVEELTTPSQREQLQRNLDIDFAIYSEELKRRFRVSLFIQRNYPAFVIRNVRPQVQGFEELNLPAETLRKLCLESRGLILLTGSAGSGKSTTIASMMDCINTNLEKHIITIEEPIEFTFEDKNSVINQREIGLDVVSYPVALRAFTLQSPDVIFIGNIRDRETMFSALTAAETGVLVLSTLHTVNAPQTIERIVNFFPPHQHNEIRTQLSFVLKGVISLRLVPRKDTSGRIPAYEVMLLTPTISRLIREGKIWEIPRFIEEGFVFGMQSFTQSLIKLVKEGKIREDVAAEFSDNKEEFALAFKGIKKS